MCIVQQAMDHAEHEFGGDPYKLRVVMANGETFVGYAKPPVDGVLTLDRVTATFVQIAHIASITAVEG